MAQEQEAVREIVQVSGDLYRYRNNAHFGVFLVTDEGIIVADPINADASEWLLGELETRFDVPVRYLIYSHHHGDHVSGGEVYASAVEIVAHTRAAQQMVGNVPPDALPDTVFEDEAVIELGGSRIELIYLGPSHSDSLIAVLFPAERALFAVDAVSVRRLPFRNLGDSYYPGLVEALDKIIALDFDILIPGHGEMGSKQDAADYRGYLVALVAQVRTAMAGGLTIEEAQEAITMEAYADWGQHEAWLPENIAGLYRLLGEQGE